MEMVGMQGKATELTDEIENLFANLWSDEPPFVVAPTSTSKPKPKHRRRMKTGNEPIPILGDILWERGDIVLERTATRLWFHIKTRAIYRGVYKGASTRQVVEKPRVEIPIHISHKLAWFEERYITPIYKLPNHQVVRRIWKYRDEWSKVLPEGVLG
jgi:hypothetical protein